MSVPGEIAVRPFIGGEAVDSHSNGVIDVVNPASGRVLFAIPEGCDHDVDRAVANARATFDSGRWSDSGPSTRRTALHKLADLIETSSAELDALDAEEMGKPISTAVANAFSAAGLVRFFAEASDKVTGDVYFSDKRSFVAQRRVPRGIVGAVTPWNFPTVNAARKFAPAIAAGNCVVLKPSELASRSAIYLARLALEAGIPAGVFNVVPGVGGVVGRALGLHDDVNMLTFTGSTAIGKRMLQYSGESNLKAVIVECGGKSPHIVFDDGLDLDEVAQSIARFLVTNQGQLCSVGSRLIVGQAIESELIQRVRTSCADIVVGDPLEPTTTYGPLVSSRQCDRVLGYISGAEAEGAELAFGGNRINVESGGYFVEPTVFRNVKPTARLAQEEVFGPVLAVSTFRDEVEAIRIANGTRYGLSCYVWTKELSRGMRVAKAIRSTVRISSAPSHGEGAGHMATSEPFGESGLGIETGLSGLGSYLRRQLVSFEHD